MMRGRSLCFSGDGRHVAVASGAQVHFAAVDGSTASTIELPGVIDLAGIGSQIWVVAKGALHVFDANGRATTAALALPGDGILCPAAMGTQLAAWSAPPIALVTSSSVQTLAGDPEWVVPVSQARWVACGRDRIRLRTASSERWAVPAIGRVVDGALLFEGRTVALVTATPAGALAQLVVIGLHDGAIHHRITLAGVEQIRFAPARGFALMRAGARMQVLLDLRFGRVLKEHSDDRDIVDLAIDDAGLSIMVRHDDTADAVAITPVRELLAATSTVPVADAESKPNGEPTPAVEPVSEPAPAATTPVAFHHGPVLGSIALLPARDGTPLLAPDAATALLERYRNVIAAMLGRAIAAAWDDGRLTFPNEATLPFRAEVGGLIGGNAGRAKAELAASEQRVAQASAALRAAEATVGDARAPLAALCAEFELSPLARLVLVAIAAPALWGELARLYGILANDEDRPLVDELVISQVLELEARAADVARELDREAPLVKYGIVQIGAGVMRPFLPLRIEPVVLHMLRGDTGFAELEDIRVVTTARAFESLLVRAETKRAIADAVAIPSAAGAARLVVRGREGSGRHTLLATLADAAGRRLGIIDATMVLRDIKQRSEQLRASLRRAHLVGLVPCVDGLEGLPADDLAARDTVREILDNHPGPIALRLPWDAQAPLAPGYVQIDLPPLSIVQRIECWKLALGEHDLDVREPEEIAVRYGVGPGVITNACMMVASRRRDRVMLHGNGEAPRDLTVELEDAIRQHLDTRLRATATRVTRLASWSRVVLPPDIQESVLELIARIKHRRIVYDTWGFDQVLTSARGVTALFSGGPGTGKTLVASAIANELGMDLYRVDLSRVMSKWIGETEQNLAKLFDAAEDGHAIILFDEADSLFAKRTEVRSSVDRYANLEVNYLLQRLDTFEGIAILTTNFGTSIDSAFKRRLSFRLTFPFPDEEARESLWRSHIPPNVPRAGDFDFSDLARRYRLSGGYIRNAALRAAFLAAEEHAPLTQDHLERAIKAEFREIGKIAESGVLE
jgi:hypothetical protein